MDKEHKKLSRSARELLLWATDKEAIGTGYGFNRGELEECVHFGLMAGNWTNWSVTELGHRTAADWRDVGDAGSEKT